MNLNDKRVIKTRRNIKTAFKTLLERKEFQSITVAELSREAMIDRKTFYLHYDNTIDLLKEFEDDLYKLGLKEIEGVKSFNVYQLLKVFNKILVDYKVFYKNMSLTGRNQFFLNRTKEAFKKILRQEFLAKNQKYTIKLNYQLEYIVFGISGLYMTWLADGEPITLRELSNLIELHADVNIKNLINTQ